MEQVQLLTRLKKYDEAEVFLNKIINEFNAMPVTKERDSKLSTAYNDLGYIFYKKVEFNKAQVFYSKSIEKNPLFGPAYYNRAVIKYRLGAFEDAQKDFYKAVELEPENIEFMSGLQDNDCKINDKDKI